MCTHPAGRKKRPRDYSFLPPLRIKNVALHPIAYIDFDIVAQRSFIYVAQYGVDTPHNELHVVSRSANFMSKVIHQVNCLTLCFQNRDHMKTWSFYSNL